MTANKLTSPLPAGKTAVIIDEVVTEAGTTVMEFGIDSDSVLISLFAEAVTGSLDVVVKTVTDNNQDVKQLPVITFPTITAATSNLVIRKAAAVMSRIRVEATYTGAATFQVWARGVGSGETSVRILGAANGQASQTDVGTTASLLVGAAVNDRTGIIIRNNNPSGVLYLGFSVAETTLANGYPLGPGENVSMDMAADAQIYGIADVGTIDTRIMESST
jgi:hypothetical protein